MYTCERATHSSSLAWKIPWRSLVCYSPQGCKESDMTEQLHVWLIHINVWQKPTQHCKAIILQLKINFLKKDLTSGSPPTD